MSKSKLDTSEINLFKEAALSSVSHGAGVILSLLQVVVLTSFLSVSEVGIFFFYLTLVYLFSQITKGVSLGVRKRVSSVMDEREEYFYAGLFIILFLFIAILIILSLLSPFIKTVTQMEITQIGLFVTGLVIGMKSFSTYMKKYLSACSEPGLAEIIKNYIGRLSQLILITFGLWFIGSETEIALIMYGLGLVISSIISALYSPTEYSSPKMKHIASIWSFSKWSIPNSLFNDFYQRFDTLILSIMVGSVAVGYYDSSVRLSTLGFAFAYGIASSSNIKISGLYESGEKISKTVMKTMTTSTLFVYPTLIIAIIHSETILSLFYGSDYAPAGMYLITIITYQIFQAYRLQYESIYNAIDKPSTITGASILAVVSNVLTAPLLVLYIGGIGAVVSTILSEVVRSIYFEWLLRNKSESYKMPRMSYIQMIIAILITLLIYARTHLISLSPTIGLIIDSIITTILFLSIMYSISQPCKLFLIEIIKTPVRSIKKLEI